MNIKAAPLMSTYARNPVVFVRGEGCLLYDENGKEYLDCLAGIAVVSAGHGNLQIAEAVFKQMTTLGHTSNLYWSCPMAELAYKLRELSGGWGKVFFANSGSEANECAIKLIRKWGNPNRNKILCAEGSFHGRTLGSLAATGQPSKWEGFQPLPEGFVHLPFNNLEAFERAIDDQTAAIMIEPIQGERGILPATAEFIKGLRELSTKKNILLAFDEIQCGMGRTGEWWAFQNFGVQPDIFTVAKALGNGMPIGVCIARDDLCDVLKPGSHGTTFGGNAVVTKAALATIDFLFTQGVPSIVRQKGDFFMSRLKELPGIKEVRGMGLMIGLVLNEDRASEVATKALQNGLIVNPALPDTLRIVPPLIITNDQIEKAVGILRSSI